DQRVFSGHAANTDIIVASAQAYVNALNRLYGSLQGDQTRRIGRGESSMNESGVIEESVVVQGSRESA
ncbi:MAG TPA: alpha-isopropylmalate synthase regulatory domain-containing protein, partial [Stenomitos sp.]